MSISSEISRISGNVSAALTAIGNKGVTVPAGSNSDDLATLIGSIQTGGGTPSATAHTIVFEFSDSTSTTLTGYWDAAFITSAITATTPTEYGGKTVESASFDSVAWYTRPSGTWETVYDGEAILWPDSVELRDGTQAPYPVFGSGETWRFTYGNNTYECETEYNGTEYYIGNIDLLDSLDAEGLPFYLTKYSWGWQCVARTGVSEMQWTTAILEKFVTN